MTMSTKSATHQKNLMRTLGELGFEYRGRTAQGHHAFYHPEAGPLFTSGRNGEGNVAAATRDARKILSSATDIPHHFIRWLRDKYGVDEFEAKQVRLNIAEEARAFLFDAGRRGSPSTIQSFISKSNVVTKLDHKNPALYEIKGAMYGKNIVSGSEKIDEKPIQLVHRFNDTTKMALTRAGIMTVPQLEALSLEELESVDGMGRTRVREVWDFFDRGDPYEPEPQTIEASPLPRKTKNILIRCGVETVDALRGMHPRDIVVFPNLSNARMDEIWQFLHPDDDPHAWHDIVYPPPEPAPVSEPTPGPTESELLLEQLRGVLARDAAKALEDQRAQIELAAQAARQFIEWYNNWMIEVNELFKRAAPQIEKILEVAELLEEHNEPRHS